MREYKSFIIKTGMVLFLVLYLGNLYFSDFAKDISMDRIAVRMEEFPDLTSMEQRGKSDLERYFSVSAASNPDYFYYKAVSPMSVDEAMIIKAADKSQADSYLEYAQAHLESQETVFGGYGTDQMGLLGEASVGSKGNYVYYFCGENSAAWCDAFLDLI